jgi:hypothetical protein
LCCLLIAALATGCGTDRSRDSMDYRREQARRQAMRDAEAQGKKRQPEDRHKPEGQDVIDQPISR